jgi:hypothetical protein
MMAQARRHGIKTQLFLTEVRLARQIARLGVPLQRIGGAVGASRRARAIRSGPWTPPSTAFGALLRPFYEVVSRKWKRRVPRARLSVVVPNCVRRRCAADAHLGLERDAPHRFAAFSATISIGFAVVSSRP